MAFAATHTYVPVGSWMEPWSATLVISPLHDVRTRNRSKGDLICRQLLAAEPRAVEPLGSNLAYANITARKKTRIANCTKYFSSQEKQAGMYAPL